MRCRHEPRAQNCPRSCMGPSPCSRRISWAASGLGPAEPWSWKPDLLRVKRSRDLTQAKAAALSVGALSNGQLIPPVHPPIVSLQVSQTTASKQGDATNSMSATTRPSPANGVILTRPVERGVREYPGDAADHGTAPTQTIKIGTLPHIVRGSQTARSEIAEFPPETHSSCFKTCHLLAASQS